MQNVSKCLNHVGMSSIVDALKFAVYDRGISRTKLLVTGSSGWLGRNLLELLTEVFGEDFNSNVLAVGSFQRKIQLRNGYVVSIEAWDRKLVSSFLPTHIVHLAFVTRDRMHSLLLEEFRSQNELLRREIAWAASIPSVKGLLTTSSGAVTRFTPDSYGELKKEDEEFFAKITKELERNFLAIRVWSVSGPYIKTGEIFALQSFITSAMRNEPIEIMSEGPVWRTYMNAKDVTGLSLLAQLQKRSGILNSGGTTLLLTELADKICFTLNSKSSVEAKDSDKKSNADLYISEYPDLKQYACMQGISVMNIEQQIQSTYEFLNDQ
jgi:UDP-glucuronate decarboxylase